MYGQEIVGSFTSPRVASVHAATRRQMAAVISERPTERRGSKGKDKEKYGERRERGISRKTGGRGREKEEGKARDEVE